MTDPNVPVDPFAEFDRLHEERRQREERRTDALYAFTGSVGAYVRMGLAARRQPNDPVATPEQALQGIADALDKLQAALDAERPPGTEGEARDA